MVKTANYLHKAPAYIKSKKVAMILLLFMCAFPLFARDVTITVNDFDLDIPLEGAVIHWDGNEFICDEDGKAVIQTPDRQVLVHATYPGYETGRLIIPVTGDSFTINLRLSGVMQGRELVVEAARPGASESRTGRSVALSAREIAQSAEIGIIEDVMNAIKLLPGVNYGGFFSSQPSIRGGHPGEMSASLDGFYISNPYHWGGAFSIFDPRMVESAQLSHGVFSSRYGHTISGLLEITTKKPSPTETQFELGLSTSTANLNLSLPLFGKGGILFIGRLTYYDPIVYLAKQLTSVFPEIEVINSIVTAPYIRSGTITGNYRFTDNLELSATGFFGMDGTGVNYVNSNTTSELDSDTTVRLDFINLQGYFTSSLVWNPRTDMLLKFSLGSGFEDTMIDGHMTYNIRNKIFSDYFTNNYPYIGDSYYEYYSNYLIDQTNFLFNLQSRLDFDMEISDRLMFSAGIQEMYNFYRASGDQEAIYDVRFSSLSPAEQQQLKDNISILNFLPASILNVVRISVPVSYSPDAENNLFSTSGYILGEFNLNRFKAEFGLRIDHFYLLGNEFSLSSDPAFNPRLNLDFNLLKGSGFLRSLDLSVGTGLFSSINDNIFVAEERYGITNLKPNRSWTSILGIKLEFPNSLSLNIEGYYKYIFDRMYIPVGIGLDDTNINAYFNGEGISWGIDVMLQKFQGRFWDGWLTYSYNWAKYRDPNGSTGTIGLSGGNQGTDWYYPTFHRFHNLNLIINIKPVPTINFYLRFGLASGVPLSRMDENGPISYPVIVYSNTGNPYVIEKYYWSSYTDDSNRTTISLPMDIKFSIFGNNAKGKTQYEVYVAIENVLSLFYQAQANTRFNQYTGQVDTSSTSASYDIPIPIPSFGFKISY